MEVHLLLSLAKNGRRNLMISLPGKRRMMATVAVEVRLLANKKGRRCYLSDASRSDSSHGF